MKKPFKTTIYILSASAIFATFNANAFSDVTTTTPGTEAVEACSGKNENEVCSFNQNGLTLSGTCKMQTTQLVCTVVPASTETTVTTDITNTNTQPRSGNMGTTGTATGTSKY